MASFECREERSVASPEPMLKQTRVCAGRHELIATLLAHLHVLYTRGTVGAGPDERMHNGLAPFQTICMPLPIETHLQITRHRAQKDIDAANALIRTLRTPLPWPADGTDAAASTVGGSLRLGLISSDFGDHPVGHALLPWVRALRRQRRLKLVCIASDSTDRRHTGTETRRDLAEVPTRIEHNDADPAPMSPQ